MAPVSLNLIKSLLGGLIPKPSKRTVRGSNGGGDSFFLGGGGGDGLRGGGGTLLRIRIPVRAAIDSSRVPCAWPRRVPNPP